MSLSLRRRVTRYASMHEEFTSSQEFIKATRDDVIVNTLRADYGCIEKVPNAEILSAWLEWYALPIGHPDSTDERCFLKYLPKEYKR